MGKVGPAGAMAQMVNLSWRTVFSPIQCQGERPAAAARRGRAGRWLTIELRGENAASPTREHGSW